MSKEQLSEKLPLYKFLDCLNATYLDFLEFQQQQKKISIKTYISNRFPEITYGILEKWSGFSLNLNFKCKLNKTSNKIVHLSAYISIHVNKSSSKVFFRGKLNILCTRLNTDTPDLNLKIWTKGRQKISNQILKSSWLHVPKLHWISTNERQKQFSKRKLEIYHGPLYAGNDWSQTWTLDGEPSNEITHLRKIRYFGLGCTLTDAKSKYSF